MAGTDYLHTHNFNNVVMLPATDCSIQILAVFNINNLRDIKSDRENGKNTLAVQLGAQRRAHIYHVLLSSVLCFALFILCNLHSLWGWLFLLAIALLVCYAVLRVLHDQTPVGMRLMLEHMVKAALLTNLLFAIGVALS